MSENRHIDEPTGFEVAVIGAAGRFPGASTLDEYWRLISEGRETIRRFSRDELIAAGADPDAVDRPAYVPVSPMIGDVDLFDASFFNFSPREAEVIDPQGRILLELAWHALESSGYSPDTYEGLIGTYMGGRLSTYMLRVYRNPEVVARSGDMSVQIGSDKDYLATRISYKLDLGGPAVTVQTACSTALVGVHMACQALIAGECDMALAGGSSIKVPEVEGYTWSPGGVLSRSGHIRAFDAEADGTVFGNGLGLVVLKRLDDALADRDRILGVIKGSAVSNDGSQRVGFTAPGVDGQRRVVRAAQLAAEIDADTITYIEAHGTGTPIGDPIEIDALTRAFRESTDKTGYCAVTSAKSNIGHLSAAAGIAGLIKVLLAMEHRQIPPAINFDRPNPQIDFEASPFYVNRELTDWTVQGMPRRAGVSAFGIGGTNAHVIVEEAPRPEPSEPSSRDHQIILLSARTGSALDTATDALAKRMATVADGSELADVAFTLQQGRKAFEQRRLAVCRSAEEAARVLGGEAPARLLSGTVRSEQTPVVFMFSGQGSQYAGMGAGLYREEPVFRDTIDRCAELVEPELGRDLRALLLPEPGAEQAADEALARTELTQPALFAVEYALATLWMSWGVRPAAMIGHSIGEYVAATVAGVLGLEDALRLVAARGRLMQAQPPGDMLSVPLPEAELAGRLGPDLSLAAVNAPSRCVVSGPADSVAALADRLDADGIACRPLHTSHAFHSAMMESMLPAFLEAFEGVELRAPEIPFVSNVSGDWITEDEATDPGYWARHVREAVRFAAGLETLAADGPSIFLEVGPGKSLATLTRQNRAKPEGSLVLPSMRHPKDDSDDETVLLEALGKLWLAGSPVDWTQLHGEAARQRVDLPVYPFERRSYWVDPSIESPFGLTTRRKTDPADWYALPTWKPSVTPAAEPAAKGGSESEAGATGADDEPAAPAPLWVLFTDEGAEPLAAALEEHLAGRGARSVRVAPGEGFAAPGDGRFAVGGSKEDYELLLRTLTEGPERLAPEGAPLHVLHLWSAGEPAGDETGPRGEVERGFWSLLHLAQAVGATGGDRPVRLAAVTTGMQQVAGEPVPHPGRATVLGPSLVIPAEYARVRAAAVDLDLAAGSDPRAVREMAEAVVAEIEGGLPDRVVAYRAGDRWVRGFEQVRLGEATPERLRFRDGGVYLVTGGLGGFGRTFAEHLAREHGARLVLLGRSALPERERWDRVLETAPQGDRTAAKIRAVRELEEMGAEVVVEAVDVTDAEALTDVVRRARERFGALHGVIHAAGVAGGGMIQLKDRASAAAVLAPKIEGTLALEAALEDAAGGGLGSLDFLVLCSSTIAVIGGFGQVDYCAANNFMDAFARSRRSRRPGDGPYVVSLNWTAWKDVGMAVETALPSGPARGAGTVEPFTGTPLHPLLDALVEGGGATDETTVFSTVVSADRQWVLDEHRIQGTPTIPGTTYLEMVRAAVARIGDGSAPVEIRDLYFLQPVMVPEGRRREVRLTLERSGDHAWTFTVTSTADSATWTEHARGRVAQDARDRPAAIDLDALRERCSSQVLELTGEELGVVEKLVYWGPRWHSLRRVHIGDGEGLIHLELPAEFAGDVEEIDLHPALVDVATAVGGGMIAEGNFLPLSYRRIRVDGALPASFDSHIRVGAAGGKETLSLDVTLLAGDGTPLVAIEGFTMKRVGASAASLQAETGGEPAADGAVAAEAVAAGGDDGAAAEAGQPQTLFGGTGMAPAEGVEALRRVLARGRHPQIVVAQRDVETMIAQVRAASRSELADRGEADQAAGGSHPRPDLATAFVAPRNDTEQALAAIWAGLLGLDEVGVHDNFFELGGDSILGIRVINQAAQQGLELSPEMLFENQTVAELAACHGGDAGGPVPATPYQREMLEGDAADRRWLAWTTTPADGGALPDPDRLREALAAVAERHPVLGLRWHAEDRAWQPGEGASEIVLVEGGADPEAAACDAVDLAGGVPVAAALGESRWALAGDRRLIDEESLELLARRTAASSEALAAGRRADVPAERGAFVAWVGALDALREEAAGSVDRWLELAAGAPLVSGHAAQAGGGDRLETVLSPEETRALGERVTAAFRTTIDEVILAALADAAGRRLGADADPGTAALVRVERSGRGAGREWSQAELPDLPDVTDGVGCFRFAFPIALERSDESIEATLQRVKQRIRTVPHGGLSWGLLRQAEGPARERTEALAAPDLGFAFLGSAEAGGLAGAGATSRAAAVTPIELRARLGGEGLRLEWRRTAAVPREPR